MLEASHSAIPHQSAIENKRLLKCDTALLCFVPRFPLKRQRDGTCWDGRQWLAVIMARSKHTNWHRNTTRRGGFCLPSWNQDWGEALVKLRFALNPVGRCVCNSSHNYLPLLTLSNLARPDWGEVLSAELSITGLMNEAINFCTNGSFFFQKLQNLR